MKYCGKCRQFKSETEFYKNQRGGCRICVREYQNRWYKQHRVLKHPQLPEGLRRCNRCSQVKSVSEFYHDKSNQSGYHHYCKGCVDSLSKQHHSAVLEAKRKALAVPFGYKRCSACQQILPLKDFGKLKESSDGFRSACKICVKARRKVSPAKRRETPAARERRNAKRRVRRHTDEAYRAKERADRHEYQKREIVRAKAKLHNAKYRAVKEHQETARRKTIEWRHAHPEQIRQHSRNDYARKKGAAGSYTDEQWLKLLELCGGKCLVCGEVQNLTRDHIVPLKWGGTNYIENLQPLCHKHNTKKQAAAAADYRPSLARAWAFLESIPWKGDDL